MTNDIKPTGPLFQHGIIVFTARVTKAVPVDEAMTALERHCTGDWGEVCEDDKAANDWALLNRTTLLSAYTSSKGVRFWIKTEGDRSVTTMLLPGED